MGRSVNITLPRDRRVSEAIRGAFASLGTLAMEVEAAERHETEAAVPTWTNQDGITMRVSDMPTPYLENVMSLLRRRGLSYGPGSGLAIAIARELAARSTQSATL